MPTGTIKRLTDKGYGFIKCEDRKKDLFFHASKLVGAEFEDLREGLPVSFEIEEGEKGPCAVRVSVTS